jgi:hypothetical protein
MLIMKRILLVISLLIAGCATKPPVDLTDKNDVCALHGITMEKKEVRVIRGFPKENIDDENIAAQKWFPHGLGFTLGEAIREKDDPKKALIYTCPECVIARNKWFGEWKIAQTNDVGKKYGF